MAFTYDISTNRGKVRFLSTDSDALNPVFTDDEVDAVLALVPSSLYNAAALLVEVWAQSRSKLSLQVRQADGSFVLRNTPEELLSIAAALRAAGLSGSLVTGNWSTSTPGELLDSYRPEWRGISDLPVVE